MADRLTHEQIEDLLDYIGVTGRTHWKNDKIQFNCPIHGESHPSCGINADLVKDGVHKQVFHCFSCGASGTLSWFLYLSLKDDFKNVARAEEFISNRYDIQYLFNVDKQSLHIPEYEEFYSQEDKEERFILPKTRLAIYHSGKMTYDYYIQRGFSREDIQRYMVGYDDESKTITFPIFWDDGELAGLIGRYVTKRRKNERFKIYAFPKGEIIYPLNLLEVTDGTIIGVESIIDCQLMHKWGFKNTIAILGNQMTKKQADLIAERCDTFIDLFDNDDGGNISRDFAKRYLKNRVTYKTVTYPSLKYGKDPDEWGKDLTIEVLSTAKSYLQRVTIPRY